MTKTVDIGVAQATLAQLIAGLQPDDEVVIVENQKPIGRLFPPKMELLSVCPVCLKMQ